jgi:hypothetical protein
MFSCIFFLTSCRFQSAPKNCGENKGKNLLIFIGEKIEIKDDGVVDLLLPYEKYRCKYKVVQMICGEYQKEIIEFIALDHYGTPAFSRNKHAVLYLSQEKDSFYHEMYLYDHVYKTKDRGWASPYSFLHFNDYDSSKYKIQPHKTEFAEEVSFDVKGESRKYLESRFPAPYYKIENKRAIALYGNTVEEVVEMTKRNYLAERGFYGKADSINRILVQDVSLADIKPYEEIKFNKAELFRSFNQLIEYLKRKDTISFKKMSFPRIYCSICEEPPRIVYENNVESIDSFVTSAYKYLMVSQLMLNIENKIYKLSAEKNESISSDTSHSLKDSNFIIYRVSIVTVAEFENSRVPQISDFEFVKVNGKFKFYGLRTNIQTYNSMINFQKERLLE